MNTIHNLTLFMAGLVRRIFHLKYRGRAFSRIGKNKS